MDEQEYMTKRLDDQLAWYDRKSMAYQRWYKRLRLVEIVSAASIPLWIVLMELADGTSPWPAALKGFAAGAGVIVVIVSSCQGACKFQENWMAYRTTCEMLKHEKYFYKTDCGPYKQAKDKFCLLVQRVEELISQENTNWQRYMKEDGESRESATT